MEEVCYTRETALQNAVEMETKAFEHYKNSYLTVKSPLAKDLLKDLALDELRHKYNLEKAFFEEMVSLHDSGIGRGPEMKLTLLFEDRVLGKDSTEQDVLLHAIHHEKRTVDFFSGLAQQCSGAPMESMFKRLSDDEKRHLSRLEELYEKIYMNDM